MVLRSVAERIWGSKKKAATVEQLHRQKILKNASLTRKYPRFFVCLYTIVGLSVLYSSLIYDYFFKDHLTVEELLAEYPRKKSPEWLQKEYERVLKERALIAEANKDPVTTENGISD